MDEVSQIRQESHVPKVLVKELHTSRGHLKIHLRATLLRTAKIAIAEGVRVQPRTTPLLSGRENILKRA